MIQQGGKVKRCRLPRSGRPSDRNELALGEGEIHSTESFDATVGRREALADMLHLQYGYRI
ncbi:MAG: hypothetical protein ACE5MG_12525, partial [Candidatus Methylomirabilales bacterium]